MQVHRVTKSGPVCAPVTYKTRTLISYAVDESGAEVVV
jgi:hypothetical protein